MKDRIKKIVEEFQKTNSQLSNLKDNKMWQDIQDWAGVGTTRRQNEYQTESMKMAHNLNQQSADVAWEREMEARGNQYQTAVQDMTKAGLNPVLALSGGAGVPTAQTSQVSAMSGSSNGGSGLSGIMQLMTNVATTAMKVSGNVTTTAMKLSAKKK